MNLKNTVLFIALAVAIFSTSYLLKSGCRPGPVGAHGVPVVPSAAVTPITDPGELAKLPQLPNHERPVSAIPVPTSKPDLGMTTQTAVVVSSAGNTYVVRSESIAWGLEFDPKLSLGVSSDLLLGLDVSFFRYWRLGLDVLAYIPVRSDLDFTRTRGGLGLSCLISPNTSLGFGYMRDLQDRPSWVGFVSIKF